MMKTKISVLVVFTLIGLLSSLRAEKVEVTVVDKMSEPVEDATVDVWYAGFSGDQDVKSSGFSDKSGKYVGRGNARYYIEVHISKEGWYKSEIKSLRKGQDHSVTVVMRKIENPVPLFVRDVFLKFPVFDEWLGFDFEAGDWVAPQGKGNSRDVLFKFHREYIGSDYTERELAKLIPRVKEAKEKRGEKWDPEEFKLRTAKWDGVLWIDFPSDFGGIVEEKNGYLPYSKMKMPHLAPEEGYQSEEIEIKKKSYRTEEDERKGLEQMREYVKSGVPDLKPSGYYIRTRVTAVGDKVIKANYAKLATEIEVGAGGSIGFIYYFNPTPNDRNLEYRSGSNLATEQKQEYEP